MQKQIDEVMGLVDDYVKANIEYDSHLDDVPLYDECMDLAREQLDKKRAIIKAKLRELLPVWLPIESHPRTTKAILVWCPERKNKYAVSWEDGGDCDSWRIFGADRRLTETPTHWMPLPKATE